MLDNDRLENLLARTALKDRNAFRELYDHAAPHLFGVAIRILSNRALAEEALQDGFVQIWQNAGTFQTGRAMPSTWITSIVRYRALDLLRRAGRETPIDDVPESHLPVAPLESDASEEPKLRGCMDELVDQQRTCISLAFVDGYTHQELCARLKLPLGTIKSLIRRGLRQLKECLER